MNIYMTRSQARRYNRLCNQAARAKAEIARTEQELLALAEELAVCPSHVNKRAVLHGYAKLKHERIKVKIKQLVKEVKDQQHKTNNHRGGSHSWDLLKDLTHRELGMLLRDRCRYPIGTHADFLCMDKNAVSAELERRRKEKKADWEKTQPPDPKPEPECSREQVAMAIVHSTHPFWSHNAPRVYAGWAFREACEALHLPVSHMNIREVAIALFRGDVDLPLSRQKCYEEYIDKINQPRNMLTLFEEDCLEHDTMIARRRLLAARNTLR